MRTKASIKGHSIHQMIIGFPIAFLTGSFVFDLIGKLLGITSFWQTGFHLAIAGIIMGLVAAVPGLTDFLLSVPPESTAKTRGIKHMAANVTTLIIFAISLYLWKTPDYEPGIATMILQLLGLGTLSMGGWMGGTLVDRNFIGPDHRYAQSGKWKETSLDSQPGKDLIVAEENELKVNQMKLLKLDGKRIVLGKTEDGYVAFDDHCTHRGGSLADGVMICNTVQCLWHGSQFNLKTGEVKSGPAKDPIKTYRVEQKSGKVFLKL